MKNEFEWNEETAKEYGKFCVQKGTWLQWEDFINSKEPKKEYEILSFYSIALKSTLQRCPDGTFGGYCTPEKDLVDSVVHDINSVKRLSDGEVFTVGDRIVERLDNVIDAFWLNYAGNPLWISTNVIEKHGCSLDRAKKAPKYSFVTQDGKEIFEGDKAFLLNTENWIIPDNLITITNPYSVRNDSLKYFSTQEAAYKYVLMNKPVLSAQDIVDYFATWVATPKEYSINAIIELAKSKL